ncbi:hypothetical protein M378DRAFT_74176 [Amanita muscaria Koide BX008]|uniref:Uncharacterized protein n=1 Tax=Amanita muscaria (strain Koide BX008) TaxID=946122 RepID=A0A0C2TK24_AMAMK|nr:hypothetical protein M378DRAFT_74176 [Amanita muscaria Koide BX008]
MLLPLITLLAGSSPLVSAGPVLSERGNNDLLVLKFADVLEQLECSFYATALGKFKEADFTTAGFLSAQIPIEQFSTIQKDESTHSIALQAAIKSAGSSPITSCQFNFDAALTDVPTMAATARLVENVGVGAYLGAAHLISDPVLLTTAGSILTVEARHQTVLNILSGTGTPIPAAFDIALKPEEVLAIASPLFKGSCDLGVKPNPTLSITNSGTVGPGTMLNFNSSALTGSQNNLFCQMMVGGNATAIALPLSQCVVPQGINGPVAIFITSDGTPLANDVVNRASDKLVAGPTMAFIDTQPQLLSQLAVGGKNNTGSGGGYTQTISPSAASSIVNGATSTGTTGAPVPTATAMAAPEPFVGTPGGQNDFVGKVGSGITVNGWKPVPKPM